MGSGEKGFWESMPGFPSISPREMAEVASPPAHPSPWAAVMATPALMQEGMGASACLTEEEVHPPI